MPHTSLPEYRAFHQFGLEGISGDQLRANASLENDPTDKDLTQTFNQGIGFRLVEDVDSDCEVYLVENQSVDEQQQKKIS